jgi:hypothetical protein
MSTGITVLGVIVPTGAVTAVLLWRSRPWGYTLGAVVLVKLLSMGTALIAMILVMALSGVKVDPVQAGLFVLISLTGIILAVRMLQSIPARRTSSAQLPSTEAFS